MAFQRGMGLSVKIGLCTFLVIAATFAGVAIIVSSHVRAEVNADQTASAARELDNFENFLELWIHDSATVVELNAQRAAQGADPTKIRGEFVTHVTAGTFREVFATDKTGTITAATNGALLGRNIADMSVWTAFQTGDRQYFVTPYPVKSLVDQQSVLMIAAPIPARQTGLAGLLVVSLDVRSISRALLVGRTFGRNGYYSIMDDTATVLANPDESLIGTRSPLSKFAQAATSSSHTSGALTYSLEGTAYYTSWVRLEDMPWVLSITIPREDLLALSQDVATDLFGGGIISLIITVALLALLMGRIVVRRIARLGFTLGIAATGDLTTEAQTGARDEVGLVAERFNGLMESFRGRADEGKDGDACPHGRVPLGQHGRDRVRDPPDQRPHRLHGETDRGTDRGR